jgi:chorismate mutase / prephenate dehydrogenase
MKINLKKTNLKNLKVNSTPLIQVRKQLDEIDTKLIDLIVKRISLIPLVADIKKQNNLPRYDVKREKLIIKSKRALAKDKSINPDLIEDIFKRLIKESHKIEKKILKR